MTKAVKRSKVAAAYSMIESLVYGALTAEGHREYPVLRVMVKRDMKRLRDTGSY